MSTLKAATFFNNLGDLAFQLWRKFSFDHRCFPQVAIEALTEHPPHSQLSLTDIVELGMFADPMLEQFDIAAQFGQPPLTVYRGNDFHIEVLFWTDGLPAVHDH